MSGLHNKQGEQWPEEITVYANGTIEDRSGFDKIRFHEPPEERYVPASKLSEVEKQLEEEKSRTVLLRAGMDRLDEEADQEEQRADRLQAIIEALTQQEAVEAVARCLAKHDGFRKWEPPEPNGFSYPKAAKRRAYLTEAQDFIQAALQTAKEQVEGTKVCEACHGSGWTFESHKAATDRLCEHCEGTGKERRTKTAPTSDSCPTSGDTQEQASASVGTPPPSTRSTGPGEESSPSQPSSPSGPAVSGTGGSTGDCEVGS
jgi:hypothetical protein